MDFSPDDDLDSGGDWRFVAIVGSDIACDAAARFYTRYLIKVQRANGATEVVARRYREFRALYETIRELPSDERPPRSELPRITSKKFSSLAEELIEKRKRKLSDFLLRLSSVALLFPSVNRELVLFFTAVSAESSTKGDSASSGGANAASLTVKHEVGASPSARLSEPRAMHGHAPASERAEEWPSGDLGLGGAVASTSRCSACDKPVTDNISAASAGAAAVWDRSRFCSPQCERFYSAMNKKGFTITAIGGQRQITVGGDAAASTDAVGSHTNPAGSSSAPTTSASSSQRLTSLRAASTWWGSARKGGLLSSGTTPAEQTRPVAIAEEGGSRRGSSFAGVSSGEEGGGSRRSSAIAAEEEEEEQRKFFSSRRRPHDNARVLTKWSSVRALLQASSAASLLSGQRISRESSRDLDSALSAAEPGARTSSGSGTNSTIPSTAAAPSSAWHAASAPPLPPPAHQRTRSAAAVLPASVIEVVHHRGLLWKRGGYKGGRKSWKSRYFELKDRTLYYFGSFRG
jgi:hypothetical protein